eukprot:TRINITY_DN3039_c0_g2_i4.p1 TRINITY_DN3039_c0_g2~~TRINITY_DN3039_c0_g2_i4.p1  ORF type:complete len:300 (-),score=63.74 TRINITY_DN3039_c0_g2_i4:281-1180(-)
MDAVDSPFVNYNNNHNSKEDLLPQLDFDHMNRSYKRAASTPENKQLIDIETPRELDQIQSIFMENAVLEESVAVQLLVKELEGRGHEQQQMGDQDLAKAVYQHVAKTQKYITFKQFTSAVYLLDVYKGMSVEQIITDQQQSIKTRRFSLFTEKSKKTLGRSMKNFLTTPGYTKVTDDILDRESSGELTPSLSTPTPTLTTRHELSGGMDYVNNNEEKMPEKTVWKSVLKGGSKLGSSFKQISKSVGKVRMGRFDSAKTAEEIGPPIEIDVFNERKNSWFSRRVSKEASYMSYDASVKED